jgi:hypothetical protein
MPFLDLPTIEGRNLSSRGIFLLWLGQLITTWINLLDAIVMVLLCGFLFQTTALNFIRKWNKRVLAMNSTYKD